HRSSRISSHSAYSAHGNFFRPQTINTKAFFLSCNVLPDWGTEVMPVNPVPLPRSKYLLNSFYIIIKWK
ncbi:hypothetical protein EAC88_23880, partial [Salmonella enterica]|nr:hypothetical protein [Salmonella enterica]